MQVSVFPEMRISELEPIPHTFGINPEDWMDLSLRLGLATLAGSVVGWNRQVEGKAAGLRTHMLVSLGAALFVTVLLVGDMSTSHDAISRAIQGVATGVGFLGAGEIIHLSRTSSRKPQVKGLTSAAAIWVTAALGVVAGCGLWRVIVVGGILTLLILVAAKQLERRVLNHREDSD